MTHFVDLDRLLTVVATAPVGPQVGQQFCALAAIHGADHEDKKTAGDLEAAALAGFLASALAHLGLEVRDRIASTDSALTSAASAVQSATPEQVTEKSVLTPEVVASVADLVAAMSAARPEACRDYAQMMRDEAARLLDSVADVEEFTGRHWSATMMARTAAVLEAVADTKDPA